MDRLVQVAFFGSAFDREPKRRTLPWGVLRQTLSRFRPYGGQDEISKRRAPCWSPVLYAEGASRGLPGVLEVHALVLDFDTGQPLDQALEAWSDLELVAHTSWSHSEEVPKFRLVLPLARPVPAEAWASLYRWILQTRAGGADPRCIDASRLFFLPCTGRGGPHLAQHHAGEILDLLDQALELAEDDRKSREYRQGLAERRAAERRVAPDGASSDRLEKIARWRANNDPEARERLGELLGGHVVERRGGRIVAGVRCPSCGRPDVWWPITPDNIVSALCAHRNSCGWMDTLFNLAAGRVA